MIIWLASFPRSGSTLFRIAYHTYTGLPTYSYANDPILARDGVQRHTGQERLPVPWKQMGRYHESAKPYLIKTHQDSDQAQLGSYSIPALLMVRDIRDTLVSLGHYTEWRHLMPFPRALEYVIDREDWAHFVTTWKADGAAVVRFEDLLRAPKEVMAGALSKCGFRPPVKLMAFMPEFGELHKALPKFFRAGMVGQWQDVLSEKQEAKIWESCGAMMKGLGYSR